MVGLKPFPYAYGLRQAGSEVRQTLNAICHFVDNADSLLLLREIASALGVL